MSTSRSFFLAFAIASLVHASAVAAALPSAGYDRSAAEAYLDGRLTWWSTWPLAARDHQTFCVSCHTSLPYALARPKLRAGLGEAAISVNEQKILDNVTRRVRLWQEVQPFYPDSVAGPAKTVESRGTESILNALILANLDAPESKLSPDTQHAFENMWAEQIKAGNDKGGWQWLQFHNAPFEGDSQYYGATLAAIAVGMAPEDYRSRAAIAGNLALLRGYLMRNKDRQTPLDQLMLVWASTGLDGLLNASEQNAILHAAMDKQQADGGFSLSSFVAAWKRRDNTPLETKSDGYATGLLTLILQRSGVNRNDPCLKRGLDWLVKNQSPVNGRWYAYSLNKQRDLNTDIGHFMSDAATAYAVMSLEQVR